MFDPRAAGKVSKIAKTGALFQKGAPAATERLTRAVPAEHQHLEQQASVLIDILFNRRHKGCADFSNKIHIRELSAEQAKILRRGSAQGRAE